MAEPLAPDPLTLQRLACEVACGLLHLHRSNYVHRWGPSEGGAWPPPRRWAVPPALPSPSVLPPGPAGGRRAGAGAGPRLEEWR